MDGNNGLDDDGIGVITVSGGTISAGGNGLFADAIGSAITVTGGTITAGTDLLTDGGSTALYGQFTGLTPGGTETFAGGSNNTPATGSFFGTLENDTVGQTFSYISYGTITLNDVAVPEPSAAALALGSLGLLTLAARRRRLA